MHSKLKLLGRKKSVESEQITDQTQICATQMKTMSQHVCLLESCISKKKKSIIFQENVNVVGPQSE